MTRGGRLLLPLLMFAFLLGATDLTIADLAAKHDEDEACGIEPTKPKKLAKAVSKRYKPASLPRIKEVRRELPKPCVTPSVSKPAAQPAARLDQPAMPGSTAGQSADRASPPVAAVSDMRAVGSQGTHTSPAAPAGSVPGAWLGPSIVAVPIPVASLAPMPAYYPRPADFAGPMPARAWDTPGEYPRPYTFPGQAPTRAWDEEQIMRAVPLPSSLSLMLITALCCLIASRRFRHEQAPL